LLTNSVLDRPIIKSKW